MKSFLENRDDTLWLSQKSSNQDNSRSNHLRNVLDKVDQLKLAGKDVGDSENVPDGRPKQEL
jgi:hypothetical protein